jgi:hypothetical protein
MKRKWPPRHDRPLAIKIEPLKVMMEALRALKRPVSP